jgi:uncharacterized protein (TIGR01777 family)
MRVLVTGGTGLIGTHLVPRLLEAGLKVVCLVRADNALHKLPASVKTYRWHLPTKYVDERALDGVDSIIHLAGAGIADSRWTKQRKAELISSRVDTLNMLLDHIRQRKLPIKTLVSASAIGYYGIDTGEMHLTERSSVGHDFAAQLVQAWESAADRATELGIRVVKLRTGIVLSNKGGALPKFMLPIRVGLGAPLASGQQYQSWIHIKDICELYLTALLNEDWQGAYNAVTSDVTTNETITQILSELMRRPIWVPNVPRFALKLILGEMADLVLSSNYVVNERIAKETNFRFKFSIVREAIRDLVS